MIGTMIVAAGSPKTFVGHGPYAFIKGFEIRIPKYESITLDPVFSMEGKSYHVKCFDVSATGNLMVFCREDKSIYIPQVYRYLKHQNGVVNCVSLYNLDPTSLEPRNFLCGSTDGTVSIYGDCPFVHKKSVQGHTQSVNDLSVDPSGNLALSVGRDSCLSIWNLVNCERTYYRGLDEEASMVKYAIDGNRFFLFMHNNICVYDAEGAEFLFEMGNKSTILCAAPSPDGLLFTGGKDCNITAWDPTSGREAFCIKKAHSNRVKGIVLMSGSRNSGSPYLVASASSNGVIKVWDIRMAREEQPRPVAELDTQSRLTCLV